jgi:hypothetical protein
MTGADLETADGTRAEEDVMVDDVEFCAGEVK